MADTKISGLPAATVLGDTDQLVIAQAGASKSITGAALKASKLGPLVVFDQILGANAASIDTGANGIPAGHAMIEVIVTGRTTQAAVVSTTDLGLQINADAGANYFYNDMTVANGVAGPGSNFGTVDTGVLRINLPGTTVATGLAGMASCLFHNYDNATWKKIALLTSGVWDTGAAANSRERTAAAFWNSTAAITRIALLSKANQLVAGSRMTILAYG